jgi:hypothetical protein
MEPVRLGGRVELTPPPARAVRARGSMVIDFRPLRSITIPSSQVLSPAKLWPPQRIATTSPCSRATLTAAATSAVLAQRAITAGRRSIVPLKTWRASS